jgi:hypothetical protein
MADGILKVGTITTSSGSGTITLGQSGETVDMANGSITLNSSMKNTPAFAATLSSTQAISNATHTVIAFANELYDTNNAYDNSTYRFTVPSGEAGTYYLKLSGYINSGDDFEPVNFQIKKNGADMIYAYGRNEYYNTFSNSITTALSVGDYIEALVFQSSGSSKNLVVDTNNYFCGHKLIGV